MNGHYGPTKNNNLVKDCISLGVFKFKPIGINTTIDRRTDFVDEEIPQERYNASIQYSVRDFAKSHSSSKIKCVHIYFLKVNTKIY